MRITLTEDEKRRILGLHGSNIIMEQSNPKVTQIQTYLKGKKYDLGTSGPNKDGIDGKWGNKTLAAVKTEFKVDLDDQGNIKTAETPTTSGTTSGTTTSTTTNATTTPATNSTTTPATNTTTTTGTNNATTGTPAQTTTASTVRTRG
jgi:hypothetical protein